jgi:hypothetical protein
VFTSTKAAVDAHLGRQAKNMPFSPAFELIKDMFIVPLVMFEGFNNMDMDFTDRLDFVLHKNSREITLAKAKYPFTMPGVVWHPGEWRWPLKNETTIPVGCPLMIRTDYNMPDRIDVERCDMEGVVFNLKKEEFINILPRLVVFADIKKALKVS